MNPPRWYPPTQVELECSGEAHWVRFEDGELITLNHTEAEQTLSALAGEKPACFELIQLWKRHSDDLRVLSLASRGPGDPLVPPPHAAPAAGPGLVAGVAMPLTTWARYGPARPGPPAGATLRSKLTGLRAAMAPPPPPVEDPVARLLILAGPLGDRLVATVAATWADRVASADGRVARSEAALTAALYGKLLSALRAWLSAPRLSAELTMIPADEAPSLARDEQVVRARLPFSWIADVHCRALSVLLGRFTLGIADADERRIVLHTVGPDLAEPRPVTITL